MISRGQRLPSQDRLANVRQVVATAIGEEEKLHQLLAEQTQLAERWRRRAELAAAKGLSDLALQARERQQYCERTAGLYRTEYDRQRRHVNALKRELQLMEGGRMRPLPASSGLAIARAILSLEADSVADRLSELERVDKLERQLAELKARLAAKQISPEVQE